MQGWVGQGIQRDVWGNWLRVARKGQDQFSKILQINHEDSSAYAALVSLSHPESCKPLLTFLRHVHGRNTLALLPQSGVFLLELPTLGMPQVWKGKTTYSTSPNIVIVIHAEN